MIYLSVILPRRGQRRRSQWPLVSLRAACCSRCPEPIVPEVEWNREAAGSVRTHSVFTIGKHTLAQNRHAQYDILFSYQAASVSWSSRRLTNSIATREKRGLRCSAEMLFINAHLPRVGHRETQVHSFISPHFNNYKHSKDVRHVLDSLHALQ